MKILLGICEHSQKTGSTFNWNRGTPKVLNPQSIMLCRVPHLLALNPNKVAAISKDHCELTRMIRDSSLGLYSLRNANLLKIRP